jgi:hypothetical protein
VALLQQLEQFLHRNPRVRRAPQCEDLPQQHPERPSAESDEQTRQSTHRSHESDQLLQITTNSKGASIPYSHITLVRVYPVK